MSGSHIDISCNGAIKLGQHVTCDGFVYGYQYRVQTHVHDDHMDGFDSSKHFQMIIMSPPTRSLLELRHAEMPHSRNIISHAINTVREYDGITIELISSSHMLGAVQVAVTTPGGDRLGYSSDFSWPLEDVIKVDSLVLDSTYGDPLAVRHYTQEQAGDSFRAIVLQEIKNGPIIIKGHRGTLYRAFELLDGLVQCPIITRGKMIREAEVCAKFGYCGCRLLDLALPEVRKLRKGGRYIELRFMGEQVLYDPGNSITINLTANWVHGSRPFLKLSDSAYKVAVSDHADFNETLEFVRQTGAKRVVTDSVRGQKNAGKLAAAISRELGIKAQPAAPARSRAWGV